MFDVSAEIKAFLGSPKKKSFSRFLRDAVICVAGEELTIKQYRDRLRESKSYRGKGPDPRHTKTFWQNLHRFYFTEWKEFVQAFLDNNISVKENLPRFDPEPEKLYADDLRVINGGVSPRGRLNKSVFWKHIYGTKSGLKDYELLTDLKALVEYRLTPRLLYPAMGKYFIENNYSSYFMNIRATYPTLSVFNPYAYANILDNVLGGKKVFTPVLSWGSPAIALSVCQNVNEVVACDVIEDVVSKSKKLFKHLAGTKTDKKFTAYCCPSEKLAKTHDFHIKYRDYFDTVFFSPPYFDLEMYDGGEQSVASYPDYNTWLRKYWTNTVKLCHRVLKPGATFSFVIVPSYKSGSEKRVLEISLDMLNIAKTYFLHVDTKKVAWGNFKGNSSSEKRKSDSFLEDLHILKKRW